MASKEIVVAETLELVELDARRDGVILYQLVCNLGAHALALIATEGKGKYKIERAVPVPSDRGNDALAHPESPAYLGGEQVIYDGGYSGLIVDYESTAEG